MGGADRRLTHLDGLRAVAALAVVLQHTLEFSFLNGQEGGLAGWLFQQGFSLGRYGVAVFFLISGFLIPSSIPTGPQALRAFAVSRFFRLYPLYWTSLAAAILLLPVIRDQHFPWPTVLANVTMLQMALGYANVIELYWTLFVEMIFYCLCAALFSASLLRRPTTPTVMACGLGAIIVTASALNLWRSDGTVGSALMKAGTFAMYLQLMFLGQAFRVAWDAGDRRRAVPALMATIAALAVYCAVRQWTGTYVAGLTPVGVFSATAAAVLTFAIADRLPGVRSAALVYLGAISYGIYLFHPIANAAVRQIIPFGVDLTTAAGIVVSVTLVTVAAADIAHRVVEKPFIALGRRFRPLGMAGPSPPMTPMDVAMGRPASAPDVLRAGTSAGG